MFSFHIAGLTTGIVLKQDRNACPSKIVNLNAAPTPVFAEITVFLRKRGFHSTVSRQPHQHSQTLNMILFHFRHFL